MLAEPYFACTQDGCDAVAIPAALAQRFCVYYPPQGVLRGSVLHIHAFGEELNKSRRMSALQSQALARAGFAVLRFDLLGCGDSAGDHGDATWADWCTDVRWAAGELARRTGASVPMVLWGQRVGALLAVQALPGVSAAVGTAPALLFWQPVSQGALALQQFLRLKAAAEMLDGGGKGIVDKLKRSLSAGQAVEVAGYRLHPALAQGLAAAQLAPPDPPGHLHWLDMHVAGTSDSGSPGLMPAAAATAQRWRTAGWNVETTVVSGPAFWQTTEIELAPALLKATTQAVEVLVNPRS